MEHQDGSYDSDSNRKVEGGGGGNEEGQNLKKIDIDSNDDKTEASGSSCNGKPKKSVRWSEDLVSQSPSSPKGSSSGTTLHEYEERGRSIPDLVPPISLSAAEFKSKVESVKGALGRWRKRVGEATRKAEDLAGNTWQHLKTSPSFTDAALGRIVQSTRVLAEGGYDKIFHQTFETVLNEELQNSFACYMSTSIGPVMGVLYVSTEKLAYCSDNPLSYKENHITQWSYYKVTIPLHQLKAVNPSLNNHNPSEKYIQIISVDNQEFWFMGFFNYTAAVNLLKEVLEVGNVSS